MRFVKFVDENTIHPAPRCIHVGASTFVMPTAEQYAAGGYYELVEAEPIIELAHYDIKHTYELVSAGASFYTVIHTEQVLVEGTEGEYELVSSEEVIPVDMYRVQETLTYEKSPKPDYAELIVGFIREAYSLNDEIAIQRQRENSEEKIQEFNDYNAYCDQCKVRAKAVIAEWEAA